MIDTPEAYLHVNPALYITIVLHDIYLHIYVFLPNHCPIKGVELIDILLTTCLTSLVPT